MYDQAEASLRRISSKSSSFGPIGRMYSELAQTLMAGPDTPLRTLALRQLADSFDSAVALLKKVRQSTDNPPHGQRTPGQRNG